MAPGDRRQPDHHGLNFYGGSFDPFPPTRAILAGQEQFRTSSAEDLCYGRVVRERHTVLGELPVSGPGGAATAGQQRRLHKVSTAR